VRVSLDIGGEELRLCVQDNGRGIAAQARTNRRSFGLIGIRERAIMLGGEVNIESPPGEGTVVRVELPMAGSIVNEGST
jgi:signal transduction histidine kinase